jgi:hypothetical protein
MEYMSSTITNPTPVRNESNSILFSSCSSDFSFMSDVIIIQGPFVQKSIKKKVVISLLQFYVIHHLQEELLYNWVRSHVKADVRFRLEG